MTDLPIICTLTPSEQHTRRETLIPGLVKQADRIEAVAGGYALHFSGAADVLTLIAKVIKAERHCCQFLRFELTVEAAIGPVRLAITGPGGTQAFLSSWLSAEDAEDAEDEVAEDAESAEGAEDAEDAEGAEDAKDAESAESAEDAENAEGAEAAEGAQDPKNVELPMSATREHPGSV